MYLNFYKHWIHHVTSEDRTCLLTMSEAEKQHAFSHALKFGTAGFRGLMGLGPNRMNVYVVRQITQAFSRYLYQFFKTPSVVVGYDSRMNARLFAEEVVSVLVANGVKAFLFDEIMPVPVVSFAVPYLQCSAGIMITASHNPKDYNGYKIYNEFGEPMMDKCATDIATFMQAIDPFLDVHVMPFDEAFQKGASYVPVEVYEAYLSAVEDNLLTMKARVGDVSMRHKSVLSSDAVEFSKTMHDADHHAISYVPVHPLIPHEKNTPLHVVYTPLNGAGSRPVQDMLDRQGVQYTLVKEQSCPDGTFPTCPYPNPEIDEVYELALSYANQVQADLIVATDPDCDRVGLRVRVEVTPLDKDSNRNEKRQAVFCYKALTGHQIGILILHYLCETLDCVKDRLVCTNIVATPLVESIAEKYDLKVLRSLVGFKYIGQQIHQYGEQFLFGFEESHGYLMGHHVRDKDGVITTLLLTQMATHYKQQGRTLYDVLEDVYNLYGYVIEKTVMYSVESSESRQCFMDTVRCLDKLAQVFGEVRTWIDYTDPLQNQSLPLTDMVEIHLASGHKMMVRPSGTEPKIKIYLFSFGVTRAESEQFLDWLEVQWQRFYAEEVT
ncbi:MAG: phospho-sugar mutase [Alcaligenaceae bacterium]|nr:phospho-sugar mutase [Alcaligenaceae bacterium]